MMSFKAECHGKRPAVRRQVAHQQSSSEEERRPKRCLIVIRNDPLSSNVPIADDRRQCVCVSGLSCVAEERHVRRCWSCNDLNVAERDATKSIVGGIGLCRISGNMPHVRLYLLLR